MRYVVIIGVLIMAATPLTFTLMGCGDIAAPSEISAEEPTRPAPYVPPAPRVGEEYVCVVSICTNGHSRGPSGSPSGVIGRPAPVRRCTCRWIEVPCNGFGIMGAIGAIGAGPAEAEAEQIAEEMGDQLVGTELDVEGDGVVGRRRPRPRPQPRPYVPPRPQPRPQPVSVQQYVLVRLCCAVCCTDGKCGCHFDTDGRGSAGPTGSGPPE